MSVLVLLMALWSGAQQPAASLLRLERVDVVGAKRYPAADIVRISGLREGQMLSDAGAEGAARLLISTGLFKSVRFRSEPFDGQLRVTFEVDEETWSVPVVFDNFVWLTDEAIATALRADVPAFDGTAPANEGAAAYIGRALQRLLDERRIAGQVQARDRVNPRTGSHQWVYRVNAPGLELCALRVPGATGVPERVLLQAAQDDIVGKDYSRVFTIEFVEGTLRQIYLKRGYLRAAFGAPAASMDATCKGIAVTLPVAEGLPYAWAPAEWIGAGVKAGKDLDALLGMKPGDAADLTKIDAGLRAVESAYDRIGHLDRRSSVAPRYDDAARKVVFAITMVEGPQYRMGAVEFIGFAAAEAANLAKKWRVKAGAVFDGTYPAEFQRDELRRAGSAVLLERRVNAETRLVDVRFTMKK